MSLLSMTTALLLSLKDSSKKIKNFGAALQGNPQRIAENPSLLGINEDYSMTLARPD